jgi:hypothetical protein
MNKEGNYLLKIPLTSTRNKYFSFNCVYGKDPSKKPVIIIGFSFAIMGDII